MSICKRGLGLVSVVACVIAAVHCGEAGTCVRFSDCDPGMTCGAEGVCVPAAPAVAAPADGGSDAGVIDAAHIDAADAAAATDAAATDAADATAE